MKNSEIRRWLDRYGEEIKPVFDEYSKKTSKNFEYGWGCLYIQDISQAAGCVRMCSEEYIFETGRLFTEDGFEEVCSLLKDVVRDVLENRLEEDNDLQYLILFGGKVTGGFGVWARKKYSDKLNKMLEEKPLLAIFESNYPAISTR